MTSYSMAAFNELILPIHKNAMRNPRSPSCDGYSVDEWGTEGKTTFIIPRKRPQTKSGPLFHHVTSSRDVTQPPTFELQISMAFRGGGGVGNTNQNQRKSSTGFFCDLIPIWLFFFLFLFRLFFVLFFGLLEPPQSPPWSLQYHLKSEWYLQVFGI